MLKVTVADGTSSLSDAQSSDLNSSQKSIINYSASLSMLGISTVGEIRLRVVCPKLADELAQKASSSNFMLSLKSMPDLKVISFYLKTSSQDFIAIAFNINETLYSYNRAVSLQRIYFLVS